MELKYILKICIAAFFIISLIMFINVVGLNFNAEPVPIEGMVASNRKSYEEKKTEAIKDYKAKCKKGKSKEKCDKTKYKDDFFEHTKYCIWTNANKCVPGNVNGRAYDKGSKLDYYYFKSKCYGNCPKVA